MAIAKNNKEFDLLFVLNRLVQINFVPEILVMNGQIMSQGEGHVVEQQGLYVNAAPKITWGIPSLGLEIGVPSPL